MLNRIVAWFSTIEPIVLGIMFYWGMMIFFTTNLITRVLKPNVASNIAGLVSDTVTTSFIITAIFAFCFALAFEAMSTIFVLNSKYSVAKYYAFASGLLSLFGLLMLIPPSIDYFTIQGFALVVVYLLLGFLPPIANYTLTHLLYDKLSVRMEDGQTMLDVIQKMFLSKLRAYYNKDLAPKKENAFAALLAKIGNKAGKSTTNIPTYTPQEEY
jgi:hypothetical protein